MPKSSRFKSVVKSSDLAGKDVEASVSFEGQEVQFAFAPGRLSTAMVMKVTGGDPDISAVIDILEGVLVDWNLVDDEDKALPVNRETLAAQRPQLLTEISRVIFNSGPNEKTESP